MEGPKSLQTVGQTMREKKVKCKEFEESTMSVQSPAPAYVSDLPSLPNHLKSFQFEQGDERTFLASESWQSRKVQELIGSLLNWMNDVLADERIVLTDIVEDMYDGFILRKVIEKFANVQFDYSPMPSTTLNKDEQLKRLHQTLTKCEEILGPAMLWTAKWTAEEMRNKNTVVIVQLIVAVAIYLQAPIPLLQRRPISQCPVRVVMVRKHNCTLYGREITADLIPGLSGIVQRPSAAPTRASITRQEERDAFDTLFDHAPEKLNAVKKSVLTFANSYLKKLNIHVIDICEQFRNGVNLILLTGLLEGYFVPLYQYHAQPQDHGQQLQNIQVAFRLLEEAGLPTMRYQPEDIVDGDAKCILRILFALYNRYQRI